MRSRYAGGESPRLDPRAQLLNGLGEERRAGDDHLEAVVIGRVVAAGDGDAASAAEVVGREIGHRRGDHADVDHVDAARADAGSERAGELGPRQPAVAADDDRAAPLLAREGT